MNFISFMTMPTDFPELPVFAVIPRSLLRSLAKPWDKPAPAKTAAEAKRRREERNRISEFLREDAKND
jgi:hypothetical protein